LDSSTGLYNYDARLYDPVVGRFITADSIVQDFYDPQLLNRYSYVRNNPLKYVDPDGHAVETAWDAFNIALGVQSFGSNIRSGNYGAAAVDAVGTIIDTAAAAIPFVPGGAGTAIKVIRGTDKVIDSANVARKSDKILDASKSLANTGDDMDTVYRGVHGNHPQFQNAIKGKASPRGGHADAALHNAGDNRSVFTSWSTDYSTAVDFALQEGPGGVVLKQSAPRSSLIRSPDVFNESEILRMGNIEGATPIILSP
jgi:RHS repeat-associated protein